MATNAKPDSPEVSVIRNRFVVLQGVITKGNVPAGLFQHHLINEDGLDNATNDVKRSNVRGRETLMEVMDSIRVDPENMFIKFCDALRMENDRGINEIIPKLENAVENLKKETRSAPTEAAEFQKLKDQLEAFHSTQESTEDKMIREQTLNCSQHLIQQYIMNALHSGIEASKIKSDMDKLCRHHFVIQRQLLVWANNEVDKASEKLLREMQKEGGNFTEGTACKPPLFSKDTLYHASLCCEAINDNVLPTDPLSFFKKKKTQHSLSEVSFSQSMHGTTPYLIARQEDVVYVAFQGLREVSQWMSETSFNGGLRDQSSKIPLRFFMDELLNNKKIVLTGFSFGGMLASCVSARLWHDTMADQEALAQQMICITFGQPFMQIEMVKEEIGVSPLFEQSIHCVFVKEDLVPLAFHYLPSIGRLPPADLSPRAKQKALVAPTDTIEPTPKPVGLFGSPVVKSFLQYIAVLQEHKSSNGEEMKPNVLEAITWLESMLAQLKKDGPPVLYGTCYIIAKEEAKGVVWHQSQTKQLAAIDLSQHSSFNFKCLYSKHTMIHYIPLILRSHLEKRMKFNLPNQGQYSKEVSEVDSLKPKINDTLTYCNYPNERVIVLEGDNLWFSYKMNLGEKGEEFKTAPESTTQGMIEFRADIEESSDLDSIEKVKVTLFTHFASSIRHTLTIKTEPHTFSVRQMQLAKHTPSQVIQLAYLCALLEQRHQESESKRFTAIANFLKEAVKVVPIESVFDAITYRRHDIALLCARALQNRKPRLQPSQHMLIGALKASIRARMGHDGRVIDRLVIPSVRSFQQAYQAACWWLKHSPHQPGQPVAIGSVGVPVTSQVLVQSKAQVTKQKIAPTQSAEFQPKKKYSDVAKTPRQSNTPIKMVAVPYTFPIFVNSFLDPAPVTFPKYLIEYLNTCLKDLVEHEHTTKSLRFGEELTIVSKMNISELYPALKTKSAHFKSPLQVLGEGLEKIRGYTEMESQCAAKLPNDQMLALIKGIYEKDVALCASLLGAFMEQQIRIPLIHTPRNTAETLTSRTAPVAVGVWALFSQSHASLKAKFESNNLSKLFVDIREYIEGISQQLPDTENEDLMYAGKLQFLLNGVQRIVTASSQYISYSLERQLCSNPKFKRSWSLKNIITQWDTIFENDALSLISATHRPLVARWLKWTILVHDLREALAQYTCIGVTGFVNSGKSLLVQKLFKIGKVKVGVQAVKRTTIPLLYNLEDTIEGLDVIDFPGVNDSSHTNTPLASLLLSLAQIIIFVVDFKQATADPVKRWLQALTKNGAPIHICLTHADLLYSECKDEERLENIDDELKRIRAHFQLDPHRSREVTFYSFTHSSDISSEELKQCGIGTPIDIGNWLVRILKTRFKHDELAERLKLFLQSDL